MAHSTHVHRNWLRTRTEKGLPAKWTAWKELGWTLAIAA